METRRDEVEGVWKPPPKGVWKVNTDAALVGGKVGIGMVVRDSVGDVVMSAGSNEKLPATAHTVEAMAALFGLQYAYEAGFETSYWKMTASAW